MATPVPATVLISVKNEERAIRDCIRSVADFDQVVVVDSESNDRTVAISKELGAEVVIFRWDGQYPKKKQWCLENVPIRNDWVLFLDGDERVSRDLANEIRDVTDSPGRNVAFDVQLQFHFGGRRLRHGHKVNKRALIRPSCVSFPVVDDLEAPGMGELEGHYQPVVLGQIGRLRTQLIHDDPDPFSDWVQRHNKYSDWEAYLRHRQSVGMSVRSYRSLQGKIFDRVPLKHWVFFFYCFVVRRGFLDGRAGLEYATALSFYYWMIGVKVRELVRQSRSHNTQSDMQSVQRGRTGLQR